MFNPISTYRIQFHKGFTLSDFEKLIPYFKKLGVSTIYASPLLAATPGSTHGYDTINAQLINPEIGTYEQLQSITRQLKDEGISWLQDIVPNHMAYHPDNTWLMDVLEKGESSPYYSYFDFVQPLFPLDKEQLMVPFLGNALEEVIANGDLKLGYDNGRLSLNYFDSAYPVNLATYGFVLNRIQKEGIESLQNILKELEAKQGIKTSEDHNRSVSVRHQLLQLHPELEVDITKTIASINEDQNLLSEVVGMQYYRLCHWQETDEQINFRRFFTVNGLICLNIHHKEVFDSYHHVIKQLLKDASIQGLRVDHIDGLFKPLHYLEQLRDLAGDDTYIVAEKILEQDEDFPASWPIQGNTGYDFLAWVNNLFTRKDQESVFTNFYNTLTTKTNSVHEQILEKKRFILSNYMKGEWQNLYQLFSTLNLATKEELAELKPEDIKLVIGEFLVHFPVYRCYSEGYPLQQEDIDILNSVFSELRNQPDLVNNAALNLLEAILLDPKDETHQQAAIQFYQRCMQFTGPLMAKGVEDTLMYTYSRFIGHNEVGDAPEAFGITIETFHQYMKERQQKWPLSINGTATHDTKRGEDARARLNTISTIGVDWINQVSQWQQINKGYKHNNFPDTEDEYFIYQTIAATFPMPGQDTSTYEDRLHTYLEKALREAKKHSNWADPNETYEKAVKSFASAILNESGEFYASFKSFHSQVVDPGIINSLGQVLLKFTCPGVPDTYQGCEQWDLSFVDPDNRRPVDFSMQENWLKEVVTQKDNLHKLWEERYTGKIKLWLTHKLLQLRKQDPLCFSSGDYLPLEVKGAYKEQVIAFERKYKNRSYLTIVPLALPEFKTGAINDFASLDWKDTQVILPSNAIKYLNVLVEDKHVILFNNNEISLNDVLKNLPFAVLEVQYPDDSRGAGVLLPVTSLSSAFGIGDIGPSAVEFVNYLSKGLQSYWQVLPLNPTEEVNGHSPYSSFSSKAGNTALISPDALVAEGLLSTEDLTSYQVPNTSSVAYADAIANKAELLAKAWRNFIKYEIHDPEEFKQFCEKEQEWLHDFALYVYIKADQKGKPWYQWTKEYKYRDEATLNILAEEHLQELQEIKWQQYVFFSQWHGLKSHAKQSGIKLIGDLPFYVSYDSVDVWVNPEIFSLDNDLNIQSVAGVPPDYFNADGQLWGMPVFNWAILKAQGYQWWINRIRKNLELFDVLRLDHFRAFSAYWEVSATESTAINGKWTAAPGNDFFEAIQKEFGTLPLLAEDLGDIDNDVHELRNNFNMPGMKVLQFAFGDDLAQSENAPHNFQNTNFFVYTGTHDNNTIKGWYQEDVDEETKQQIADYTGAHVNDQNIHHVMIKLAYASTAKTVIIPLQDILGLDASTRVNIPASAQGNWQWRLTGEEDLLGAAEQLIKWTKLYNRI
jgi:malto-oligosyltrehalose synthase/4-alpha-glucanotransferase